MVSDSAEKSPTTYKRNLVTVTGSLSANTTGSNDLSATLRVHKDDFSLYNINLANTYGHPIVQAQALALSAWGERQGFYGSSFSGWQDTILTEVGTQYFGHCHVDGTTDFVFGEYGVSFFRESDVRPRGKGYICASKPKIDASGAYVGMCECFPHRREARLTPAVGFQTFSIVARSSKRPTPNLT